MIKEILKKKSFKRLMFFFAAVTGAGFIILFICHISEMCSAVLWFLGWCFNVLSGFVAGLIIAYLMIGVVERLSAFFSRWPVVGQRPHLARGLAIAAAYLLIFGILFGVVSALVAAVTKQVQTIRIEDIPELFYGLRTQVTGFMNTIIDALEKLGVATDGIEQWISDMKSGINGTLVSAGSGVFVFANSITGFISNAIFAIIFSIYFLYGTSELMEYWNGAFFVLMGERLHHIACVLLKDADKSFSGYIRGQLADACFMTVAVSILLGFVGVPYAVVIGILSGIGNLIPYVGPVVAYGLTIGVCIATSQWKLMAAAVVLIFILQTIDGNVINPRLLSSSIDVHPVLVIVGLLFGSAVGGFAGMLLAVPVASFVKIQFERIINLRKKQTGSIFTK